MAPSILLVEDDRRLAEMVSEYLGEAGFSVSVAGDGRTGLARLAAEPCDALVLDLMLPDMDGLEVCRQLRAFSDVPVLMLTARGDAMDRVVGLEIGADDYLPKPFELASEECARYEQAALEGQPVTVRGDPRLLRRMIRNLLENAQRHGAPPIDVRVRDAGGGSVELTVCDHGPGIADAEREDAFRPFRRVGGPEASTGAGLGLALVRQIARRHGGEARYLGRVQSKSCFVVSLPGAATLATS